MAGIEFEKADPVSVGLSGKSISEYIRKITDADIPLHSLLIVKDGFLVCESYQKPYGRDTLHRMFSVTKSMVSLAIGLLAEEGKLGLDDRIADYFPEKLPENVHPYIKAITIRNMLTMRTAHNKTTYKLEGCTDWVGSFFTAQPTHYPGTFFAYDTSSTHVLAALAEKLSGKELLGYLREKFLDDIGFSEAAYCLKDPMGVSMGGSGLMATPMDIMKVMYLVMQGGVYAGKRYLPEEYLKLALTKWSDNYAVGQTFEEMQGYGYQFWRTTHNGYACFGMGGQLGICIPDKNMVIVTTADTQGRQGGVQLLYDNLWNTILADMDASYHAAEDIREETTDEASRKTAEGFFVEIPQIYLRGVTDAGLRNVTAELQGKVNGRIIEADDNEQGFVSFRLTFGAGEGCLEYENKSGAHKLQFGIGCNKETIFPHYGHRALVSGAWRNDNTFLIYAQIIDEYVGKVFMNFSFNDGHVGIIFRKIEETYYKEFNLFTSGKLQ